VKPDASVTVSDPGRPWNLLLPIVFVAVSGWQSVAAVLQPWLLGSHAVVYTAAAAAALHGGNPWDVGPPAVRFAGPPTMLPPFLPFVVMPELLTRAIWIAADLVAAAWILRRLRLPAWWLAFPPLVSAIELGHPEVLVLAFLLLPGPVAGLAAVIKPYAAFALVAERRFRPLAAAAIAVVFSAPFLPWGVFMSNLAGILHTVWAQSMGDSVFGQPAWMLVASILLLMLGAGRGLWLATPLLWPGAQPIYKILSLPAISPLLALSWAIPVPGMTFIGIAVEAVMVTTGRTRTIPAWIRRGIESPLLVGSTPTAPHVAPRPSPALPGGGLA
jgi:hypothetical protein